MNRWQAIIAERTEARRHAAEAASQRVIAALRNSAIQVRVFGSLARGDFRDHSDVDFLVTGPLDRTVRAEVEETVASELGKRSSPTTSFTSTISRPSKRRSSPVGRMPLFSVVADKLDRVSRQLSFDRCHSEPPQADPEAMFSKSCVLSESETGSGPPLRSIRNNKPFSNFTFLHVRPLPAKHAGRNLLSSYSGRERRS